VTCEDVSDANLSALKQIVDEVHVGKLSRARWLRVVSSVARGHSATEAAFMCRKLYDTLDTKLADGRFDSVFVFCSSMWPYVAKHSASLRILVDLVDVDSQKWFDLSRQTRGPKSLMYRLEARRTRALETEISRRAPVIVVSRREADILSSFAPEATCHVISNGVDLDYFQSSQPAPATAPPRCVFVGVQNYEPNVDGIEWFCQKIWPAVKLQVPDAQLDIVGKSPAPRVMALASKSGVNVTGSVPDVRPYVENATVVIAPLRVARGIQNKVLEAMSMSRAVVPSHEALDGLDVANPPAEGVATPTEWTTAVVSLLQDPDRRRRLEERGRPFVTEYFRWDANVRKIEQLLVS
jgi:sugar transferase (PEP-CTERM/EpsH1 system associated)